MVRDDGPVSLCVIAGVALSVYTAVQTPGRFHGGVERGFNTFAFFTVQSNLIVGVTALLLALRLDRRSTTFRAFRLTGLVMITVTGVVYHVALAQILDLDGVHQLGNQLVHTVVPLLAVVGWLIFGPRGQTSRGVACLSVLYPFCWLVFTLIRGAVIGWYPYPFIDVTQLGYGKAILNCFWVSLLLLGLAAGAAVLDSRLGPSPDSFPPAGVPPAARELTGGELSDGRAERSGGAADTCEQLREVGPLVLRSAELNALPTYTGGHRGS